MRDPLLHLDFASDFDELCAVSDQTKSVGEEIAPQLRRATLLQDLAQHRRIPNSQLRYLIGDFNDIP